MKRSHPNRVQAKPIWRQREDALVWGAPLVIVPALSIVPVTISLLVQPAFQHARIAGAMVVLLAVWSEFAGFEKLASVFRGDFDVLSFFAAGVMLTYFVILCCSGFLLAVAITNP